MKSLNKNIFAIFGILFLLTTNIYSMTKEESEQARKDIVTYAKQFIGVPYAVGGISADGMDCSGFLYTVSRESIGVQLPRTVAAMYNTMRIVPLNELEPGDAVFFKTVGNKISHVGLYIGKNQFLHAISDGPNTGVIISSLNQTTWNNEFAAVGQFLPATKDPDSADSISNSPSENTAQKVAIKNNSNSSEFVQNLAFDVSSSLLWSFVSTEGVMFYPRGFNIGLNTTYNGLKSSNLGLGLGLLYRYESQLQISQLPIIFSITIQDFLRLYAGPVFTFGTPVTKNGETELQPSFFPGILGIAWQSPSLEYKSFKLCFVQDVAWTVFNKASDNSALSPYDALSANLSFSSGFRVTIPASKLIK